MPTDESYTSLSRELQWWVWVLVCIITSDSENIRFRHVQSHVERSTACIPMGRSKNLTLIQNFYFSGRIKATLVLNITDKSSSTPSRSTSVPMRRRGTVDIANVSCLLSRPRCPQVCTHSPGVLGAYRPKPMLQTGPNAMLSPTPRNSRLLGCS